MTSPFNDVVVLRPGDAEGNRMVVRVATHGGTNIHAIAVPQDRPSRTGPTWVYLVREEGLTLIDAGAIGSFSHLADGIRLAGYEIGDIDRVVVTHGHADHDGAVTQLVEENGADLWAHEIYAHLLPYDRWEIQRRACSLIQREMRRIIEAELAGRESHGPDEYEAQQREYLRARRGLQVQHRIRDGEALGALTFMHTPGHSPDEICVSLDGMVFAGDHLLPEITPHPTTKVEYTDEVKANLPVELQDSGDSYGLDTYLKSLRAIADLGTDVGLLPAHRLFNSGQFNLQTVGRAGEVIQHHARRLGRIMDKIGPQPVSLEEVTRGIFERRRLIGGNFYMAVSEVVAHIELLQGVGDVDVDGDGRLQSTGSENYRQFIADVTRPQLGR